MLDNINADRNECIQMKQKYQTNMNLSFQSLFHFTSKLNKAYVF